MTRKSEISTRHLLYQWMQKAMLGISLLGLLMISACSADNTKDAGNIEESTDPAGSTSGTGDDINTGTSEDPTQGLQEEPADINTDNVIDDTTATTGGTTGTTPE